MSGSTVDGTVRIHLTPIAVVLVLASVLLVASLLLVGCTEDLPEETYDHLFFLGNDVGYGWGYQLAFEDRHRTDLFWTPPDKLDAAQKFNPDVNIRDFYIPKGYWTEKDAANARLSDGTPLNDKQKSQSIEAYNWGFYTGFLDGSKDCIEGKSHRGLP